MSYKMKCPRCNENMIYVENKDMEELGWISMNCPNGCDEYLVPYDNPMLVKENNSSESQK